MSKINALRLINLNYNNNTIRISDEVFHLNGESTLLSLRNGGGKSVLVQMLTAPFVHKRYRDAKDRPFESYFTTNKPTFILVEWVLDQGAGYVLTGMMVRRSQEAESSESLEMVNFISEYRERCAQDIYHLPVVEKTKKEMVLKNFGACKQLFETYKRDRSMHFYYYDMNNGAQSRQYFDKLKEYQIDYKEWETIIKKVNLKESGLSDLFADCRDEKGLVEKWFLEAVESKLNKERSRMKEFQNIVEKYVGQYKDNRSKIQRRDTIRAFHMEADKISGLAETYREHSVQVKDWENKIANFIAELNRLSNEASQEKEKLEQYVELLQGDILQVEYEQASQEIHELYEKERFHISNRDMIGMEREAAEEACARIEKQLQLLDCARQQEEVGEERRSFTQAEKMWETARQKGEDLEPERKQLGSILYRYYENQLTENKVVLEQKETESRENNERIKQEKVREEELQKELVEVSAKKGGIKSRIAGYDEKETTFNQRYTANLGRNILGEYEPGELELLGKDLEKQLEQLKREKLSDYRKKDQLTEELRGKNRKLADSKEELLRRENDRKEADRQLQELEQELSVRRIIMKYLEVSEKQIFDTTVILAAAERKMTEADLQRQKLLKEEDALQKEYVRLTQGKVLELPKEFEDLLKELGLPCIFGMEYLNKNGNSVEQNQKLVREHPFLPYALILSEQELARLSAHAGEVYTSFPIPVVLRESLSGAKGEESKAGVIGLNGVSFYVLFNENLLDEEKLSRMVREKEKEIKQIQEAIRVRTREYEDYFSRKEKIAAQKVSGESYEAAREKCRELEELQKETEQSLRALTQVIAAMEEEIRQLESKIDKEEKELVRRERRLEDFRHLQEDYARYQEDRRSLEKLEKEEQRLKDRRKMIGELLGRLEEQRITLEAAKDIVRQKMKEVGQKKAEYGAYADMVGYETWKEVSATEESDAGKSAAAGAAGAAVSQEQFLEWEARYQAITSEMSVEIRILEEQLTGARKRLDKALSRLTQLKEKYGLKDGEWQQISYNRKEESHQEILLEDKKKQRNRLDRSWNEEHTKCALAAQQIKERRGGMLKRFGKEEPLPKEEIHVQDFLAKIHQLQYQMKELQQKLAAWEERARCYEEHITALSEYSQLPIKEEVTWEQNFREMGRKELREFQGTLLRDHKAGIKQCQTSKERLTGFLNQIVRREEFQDDFYRKPLEAMLELTEDAAQVISQLATTVQSYERLMEKLEVDISLVEKEKAKIVELLEDYLLEVHRNLGRIDHNSTITIREKPIKMLKIQLPEWEENLGMYQVRLNDFIDDLTQKGIEIFEKNENAQEYFGARLTTRNLYDQVVGIANVQIRLYKVEEQREYPITWAEVAKNSGGEGFLSAFIILTSLLYYMRKDESDIFADRNEGKVLLMDNPFAQTNAAHLLKPLMDMAKKTNTQLICLSGLGGDSIYNRFDNIYVLNLIAASLRGGTQYLKANHTRGAEPETMILSQIEVMEQQELIF